MGVKLGYTGYIVERGIFYTSKLCGFLGFGVRLRVLQNFFLEPYVVSPTFPQALNPQQRGPGRPCQVMTALCAFSSTATALPGRRDLG